MHIVYVFYVMDWRGLFWSQAQMSCCLIYMAPVRSIALSEYFKLSLTKQCWFVSQSPVYSLDQVDHQTLDQKLNVHFLLGFSVKFLVFVYWKCDGSVWISTKNKSFERYHATVDSFVKVFAWFVKCLHSWQTWQWMLKLFSCLVGTWKAWSLVWWV